MARASLLGGDAGAAGRALAACDPGERGWEWGYLADRLDRSERRFAPFSDGWLNLAVSRGVVAVTHHAEGAVLLDAATGRELARDPALVNVTALAPLEEDAFVAATGSGELLVLESPTLRVRTRHAVTDGHLRAVAVGAGGRVFVLDQKAGVVVVAPVTGERLGGAELPSWFGYAITTLGDGGRVAVGGDFGVMVVRTDTCEAVSLASGFGRVLAIGADASGERVVVGVEDGTMRVFDTRNGRELLARRTNDNKVNAAVFTPDGAAVVGGSTDTTLSVMDSRGGTPLARLTGHSGSLLRVASDGSGGLWSAARDGTVRRWSAGSLVGDGWSRPVPDGSPYLATSAGDGWVVLSRQGEVVWTDAAGRARETRATAGIAPALGLVWEGRSGRVVAAGLGGVAGLDESGAVLWRRDEAGTAVAVDGALVVIGNEVGMLRWIDPATGVVVRESQLPYGPLRSLAAHAGRVAAGCGSGEVVVVDADGSVRSAIVHGGVESWCVSFSPDGRRLVSAGEDGAVVVLEADTLREIGRGLGHSGAVLAAAFSPDGMRVATGGFDNTVRLWASVSMEEMMRLPGHIGAVSGLAFSADGLRLATVASDGTMRVHTSSPDAGVNADGW
jgi:WD40 repeat protein